MNIGKVLYFIIVLTIWAGLKIVSVEVDGVVSAPVHIEDPAGGDPGVLPAHVPLSVPLHPQHHPVHTCHPPLTAANVETGAVLGPELVQFDNLY